MGHSSQALALKPSDYLREEALRAVAEYTQRPELDFEVSDIEMRHRIAYVTPYFLDGEEWAYIYVQEEHRILPENITDMGVDFPFEDYLAHLEGRYRLVRRG